MLLNILQRPTKGPWRQREGGEALVLSEAPLSMAPPVMWNSLFYYLLSKYDQLMKDRNMYKKHRY